MALYGPANNPDYPDHTSLDTPVPLTGHAAKMVSDLEKVARIYTGIAARVYSINTASARCTVCTDSLTGEVLNSNCPTCNGTGYVSGYTLVKQYNVLAQLAPRVHQATEMGNTIMAAGQDVFTLIGEPLVRDRSILIIEKTKKVYKVVDSEPQVVAMGGSIITQTVECHRINPPSAEYRLITW